MLLIIIFQFHNDTETSTTDLHYFFPCLRTCEWVPRLVASVQAELPTESPAMNIYQLSCNKPYNCNNAVNEPKPMSVDNASETNMKKSDIKIECQCKEYEEKNVKKKNVPIKRISFNDKKTIVKGECEKPDNTVQETPMSPTCKCHCEESNAPDYKCEVAEQRSAEPCDKRPYVDKCQCKTTMEKGKSKHKCLSRSATVCPKPVDECQCKTAMEKDKTAMEKDKSKQKCLCGSASVCPSCRSKKFLNLRRLKCKKSSSSSAIECKCECHVDTDKKNDENCAAMAGNEKMLDVSGNSSDNTVSDDAPSSRTSLCDACNSLCEWYNYLFSKTPPATDSTYKCNHLR